MRRKIVLALLVTSFMLLTVVFPPVQYQDKEHNRYATQHGEM